MLASMGDLSSTREQLSWDMCRTGLCAPESFLTENWQLQITFSDFWLCFIDFFLQCQKLSWMSQYANSYGIWDVDDLVAKVICNWESQGPEISSSSEVAGYGFALARAERSVNSLRLRRVSLTDSVGERLKRWHVPRLDIYPGVLGNLIIGHTDNLLSLSKGYAYVASLHPEHSLVHSTCVRSKILQ